MIWSYALPGPRIVYIQRHPAPAPPLNCAQPDDWDIQQSYFSSDNDFELTKFFFSSTSPASLIAALLCTCSESRTITRKRYSTLYPYVDYEDRNGAACSKSFEVVDSRVKPTWFDFETDWLYLDWGHINTNSLGPHNYDAFALGLEHTQSEFVLLEHKATPIAGFRAKDISKILVYNYGSSRYLHTFERDTAEDRLKFVLRTFTSVKEVIIADPIHGRDAHSDELEWLFGDLPRGLENASTDGVEQAQYLLDLAEENWDIVNHSIMAPDFQWKCQESSFSLQHFVNEWNTSRSTRTRQGPTIARKIITRSSTKNTLLAIFGCEETLRQQLPAYKWLSNVPDLPLPNIAMQQPNLLSLHNQIALFELVRANIGTDYEDELLRGEFEIDAHERILYLSDKIDRLNFESRLEPRSWEEVLVSEAEEMI